LEYRNCPTSLLEIVDRGTTTGFDVDDEKNRDFSIYSRSASVTETSKLKSAAVEQEEEQEEEPAWIRLRKFGMFN
jgi:hypothetical protein